VKEVESGVLALYAGDADMDGMVAPADLMSWRVQTGLMGYKSADFDLDGFVLPVDMAKYWRLNTGRVTQIP
jgi:hypothetical protein